MHRNVMKMEVSFSQKWNGKKVSPFLLRTRGYISRRGGACIASMPEGIRKSFPSDKRTLYSPNDSLFNHILVSSFGVKSLVVNVLCLRLVQKNSTSKILV